MWHPPVFNFGAIIISPLYKWSSTWYKFCFQINTICRWYKQIAFR